ncbi:hypothetical protein B0H66DRAFT_567633 [Apodospora peruviana]|uniref:SnoaL-like domain-containing protein n=1 Tax=Apodospora peruviana TaxID=516989 RepID=A0AAE0M0W2_9PEZI|nr:hypothetical protein B0H66DRAFT_567633 [Apodospora peruviana]
MASNPRQLTDHLKSLYSAYRDTTDIDVKGLFFSPEVIQICRPQPSYAARDRETIVQFLHEAAKMGTNLATDGKSKEEPDNAVQLKRCTISPLKEESSEFEFGDSDDEITLPAGFTASELRRKAETEGWVGMRVDFVVR